MSSKPRRISVAIVMTGHFDKVYFWPGRKEHHAAIEQALSVLLGDGADLLSVDFPAAPMIYTAVHAMDAPAVRRLARSLIDAVDQGWQREEHAFAADGYEAGGYLLPVVVEYAGRLSDGSSAARRAIEALWVLHASQKTPAGLEIVAIDTFDGLLARNPRAVRSRPGRSAATLH